VHTLLNIPFLIILTFVLLGITLTYLHQPKNDPNHYTQLSENFEKQTTIHFRIKERLKPTSYYEKYIIDIQSVNNQSVTGRLLLQVPKDRVSFICTIGDSYITYARIKSIPKPQNPYQFDYSNYLARQYIFHRVTAGINELIPTPTSKISIYRSADLIRRNINQKLKGYDFSHKQLSIINALLLGQRQDVDIDTLRDYQNAGAVHLLAVSGLHVGVLLMLLNFLLKPLGYFNRKGKIIKTICIIILLWCFAVIAGLSPSVLRAVTMFSFMSIGMHIRSKTSIYNSLIVSMFILLCFRPLLLFSVGFQLSYLVVFAIIWIQPSLATLYRPRFYIDKILWNTFSVTIAAQLGVFPLSLFYFHQFPLLFFVANLMIIPILGFILGFGILVILLSVLKLLPDWMALIFGACIDFMNSIVHWVSKQEVFIRTDISFSWKFLVATYLLIISVVYMLKKYDLQKVYWVLASIVLTISIVIYEKIYFHHKEEFVVFHQPGQTVIGVLQNRHFNIYSKDSISEVTKQYILTPYRIANQSDHMANKTLKNSYTYRGKTILIIDKSGIFNIKGISPEIIILTNSPKIHLQRVIEMLQPKLVIADGSNYPSNLNQWEKTCIQQKVPFHRTDKKGVFILK